MRTALTIGLILGSEVWEFLHGPETDIPTQRADFKRLRGQREHPKYAEVQLWESGAGIVVRHRFHRPAPMTEGAVLEDPPPAAPGPGAEPTSATGETAPSNAEVEEADDGDPKADFAVPTGNPQPQPGKGRKRR